MSLRPSMIKQKLHQQKQHRRQQVSVCGVARTLGAGLWHQSHWYFPCFQWSGLLGVKV